MPSKINCRSSYVYMNHNIIIIQFSIEYTRLLEALPVRRLRDPASEVTQRRPHRYNHLSAFKMGFKVQGHLHCLVQLHREGRHQSWVLGAVRRQYALRSLRSRPRRAGKWAHDTTQAWDKGQALGCVNYASLTPFSHSERQLTQPRA